MHTAQGRSRLSVMTCVRNSRLTRPRSKLHARHLSMRRFTMSYCSAHRPTRASVSVSVSTRTAPRFFSSYNRHRPLTGAHVQAPCCSLVHVLSPLTLHPTLVRPVCLPIDAVISSSKIRCSKSTASPWALFASSQVSSSRRGVRWSCVSRASRQATARRSRARMCGHHPTVRHGRSTPPCAFLHRDACCTSRNFTLRSQGDCQASGA